MQLNLVKTSSEESLHSPEEYYGLLRGTKVIINTLQSWVNKHCCIFSAYSYFSSMQACDELNNCGFRFIYVVMISIRGLCMVELS